VTAPVVSIVVPVYNLEFYIQRCLNSLSAQTFKDIEILLVNDGSTDDSRKLLEEHALSDSRFQVHNKANGGHGSACNWGIEHARGEYVMFVDGDDFLDEDTTEFMVLKARETNADLLMGNLKYFLTGGRRDFFRPLDISTEKLLDERDRSALFQHWATPCARLYRRSLFNDLAVRFIPKVLFADVNFAPKTYYAAKRMYYVNKNLYNYDMTRPTQSMHQTDKRVLNVITSLRDMLEFYKNKHAFEPYKNELMTYTVRHCVSWLDRVKNLGDYPREMAVRELFAVLDDYFQDKWTGDALESFAGSKQSKMIRMSRRLRYRPIVLRWRAEVKATAWDSRVQNALQKPLHAYHRAKRAMKLSL